jgi:hypothetical protein
MRRGSDRKIPALLGLLILGGVPLIAFVACRTSLRSQMDGAKYAVFGATNIPPPKTLPTEEPSAAEQHKRLFEEECYPSARACARCHANHYEEWSVSPHAYAQMSPVFNAMHGSIVKLTNGTFGDFCIRCHTPVGMDLNEPFFQSNLYRHPAAREGITCIVCHRPRAAYGKISGRDSSATGSIFDKVLGPAGGGLLAEALADKDQRYGALATEEGDTGTKIHGSAESFFYLTRPGFCGTCHDVTLGNGFRLEEAFSEYKSSPAACRGVTCQDCHMGKIPGKESGYRFEPAACVNGKPTPPRKRTDHMFAGPDHSIIHPGLFPHLGEEDSKLANMTQWLEFDYEAGWGTLEFEEALFEKDESEWPKFPEHWAEIDTRLEARAILNKQFRLLRKYREAQLQVLREGYRLGEKVVERCDETGIVFKIRVFNGTDGHNVPTGFIAERAIFLEVSVRDADGKLVFRSGDVDPNGDPRDLHSLYVHDGQMPLDKQLFSLQSRFITRLLRGGEREQILAINHSVDPLPFLRPATRSNIWHGRPAGARIHRVGIEPCGSRWARYCVSGKDLTGRPPYTGRVRMLAGMVPINLVYAIKDVGFDYGMTPREVADKIVAGRQVLWDQSFPLERQK